MDGFTKGEDLKACFELVDVDQSGDLVFSEVMCSIVFRDFEGQCLMFLYGSSSHLFFHGAKTTPAE